jgi:hypothetical protein
LAPASAVTDDHFGLHLSVADVLKELGQVKLGMGLAHLEIKPFSKASPTGSPG